MVFIGVSNLTRYHPLIKQNAVEVYSEKERLDIEIIRFDSKGIMYIHYSDGLIGIYSYKLISSTMLGGE